MVKNVGSFFHHYFIHNKDEVMIMEKPICRSGRKTISEAVIKTDKKADIAAGFVMAAGCFALFLFFLFGAFGRNAEQVTYSNYANDEYEGAVSVFSQIIYPDDRTEKSLADPYDVKNEPEQINTSSANDENAFSENSETWNFWQYLCDSLAEIFGVANAE